MSAELAVKVSATSDGQLVPLLVRLRASPLSSSGAWRLGAQGRDVGVVLMERGRICWAAAVGLQRRLTDLIVENYDIAPGTIEAVYSACRASGRPLGEELVNQGLLTAPELEVVLKRHTTEAIRHVARLSPDSALWVPHNKQGYAPQFTFCLLTVFSRAAALSSGRDPLALEARLRAMSGGTTTVLAYDTNSAEELPIGLACADELELDALLELGRWARGALRSLEHARTGARVVSASTAHGVLVTIDEGDVVIAALCPDAAALARFLGQRARGEHGHLRPQ